MHTSQVNKCAAAWKAHCKAKRRHGVSAPMCSEDEDVRIERLSKVQEDRLMQNLGVVVDFADPIELQRGHTTGDGNCAWRALHKSMRGGEQGSTKCERNWKQLKKKAIAHARMHACNDEQGQYLQKANIMGSWSSRITFALVAAYTCGEVQVDLSKGVQIFRYDEKVVCSMCVSIRKGHCTHAWNKCEKRLVPVTGDVCEGQDCCDCAGKQGRAHTRRVTLETSFGQDWHFVPKTWSPEVIEKEIAQVWGCRRNWLEWTWHEWTLSAEHSCERPVLSNPCKQQLNEVAALLETAPLNGRKGVDPNVWTRSFGARTSRKHGITEGTYACGPQVQEVNRLLKAEVKADCTT
eukprot:3857701-Amphidinium_carterae.1